MPIFMIILHDSVRKPRFTALHFGPSHTYDEGIAGIEPLLGMVAGICCVIGCYQIKSG